MPGEYKIYVVHRYVCMDIFDGTLELRAEGVGGRAALRSRSRVVYNFVYCIMP